MVVQLIEVPAEETDPSAPFKLGPPQHQVDIQLSAQ